MQKTGVRVHQADLQQLTDLLTAVLVAWPGPLPRLQYVTDAGHHPSTYFQDVLQPMLHPRTGVALVWTWTVDFYHACLYVTQLGEALFGPGQQAHAWTAKMRRWLRDKNRGLARVLHSAARLRGLWQLNAGEQEDYQEAWNYLKKYQEHMAYASYRRRRLALGSGVTEAACKTLFTQRLKQSGMRWTRAGGQVIVDLRVLWLSGVWDSAQQAYWAAKPQPEMPTLAANSAPTAEKAA